MLVYVEHSCSASNQWRYDMSLNAPLFSVIPEETERVAKAAFPKGNCYLRLRDAFGQLFAREAMENVKSPFLVTDTSRLQDDTGRGAEPFLGSPSPLTFRVHYEHTGRGAGPTPRAAPRSFLSLTWPLLAGHRNDCRTTPDFRWIVVLATL